MKTLHESLNLRLRPEDVAAEILTVANGNLAPTQKKMLKDAARFSGRTSMSKGFNKPDDMSRQVHVAGDIVTDIRMPRGQGDFRKIVLYLGKLEKSIGMVMGHHDYMHDRLNREQRKNEGLDISRRRYNKLFRLFARMELKLDKMSREQRKYQFTLIGKSRLASRLKYREFSTDFNTAIFIAYYTARCNMRSEFTISGQKKAFDNISKMLYGRCVKSDTTNWMAIAHVFPDVEVLERLTHRQRGKLLGLWFNILNDIAGLLKDVWEQSNITKRTMIVQRGNDSSTWNNTASAWNKAREAWISLLHVMGLEATLDKMCPGKVMRLMAADVVRWHSSAGGGLDPSTQVWNELPLPWEVLSGSRFCTRKYIDEVCAKHRVDPHKSGWTQPKPHPKAVKFEPTPDLVHGVKVSCPELAASMKKAGWFSGKKVKSTNIEANVHRDEHGAVLSTTPA